MSIDSYGVVGKTAISTTTAGEIAKNPTNLQISGVIGVGESVGTGVSGTSQGGYGAEFRRGLAPLRLFPSENQGPPTADSHKMGEFFVDNQGTVYFCISGGRPGVWKRVQLV